ncbi:MAG: trimethylamine methyltransferase family protein [Ignavibacteriales bacterium]
MRRATGYDITPFFGLEPAAGVDAIHEATLEVLDRAGLRMLHEPSRRLLASAGCRVDGEMVYIHSALVEECLARCPRELRIYTRDGSLAMTLGRSRSHFGYGSDTPYVLDYRTGLIRDALLQDVRDAARLGERLPNIDFLMSLGLATDVPSRVSDAYQFLAMTGESKKPVVFTAHDEGTMGLILDIASLVAGGKGNLSARPFIIHYAEPTSPLTFSGEAVRKMLMCADNGIPVIWTPGPMMGATSPVTVAGSIVQANAETIGGLVLHQIYKPGAPFIYGIISSPLDMRTGVCVYGGPEAPLTHAVASRLARRYRIPQFSTAGCTDSLSVDAQAGVDAAFSVLIAMLSGADLVHDCGYVGSALVGSLEMAALDNEIIGMARRLAGGFRVDEERLAVDEIVAAGPGANWINREHTRRHFREEVWYPDGFIRRQAAAGMRDTPTASGRFREFIESVLGEASPAALAADVAAEAERLIREYP